MDSMLELSTLNLSLLASHIFENLTLSVLFDLAEQSVDLGEASTCLRGTSVSDKQSPSVETGIV